MFKAIGAHHGGSVPSPEAACVQAANAAVHLLHGLPADADVLDAALAELGLDPGVLDEVVPGALPALAPAVSGLAGRIAALERAATTDDVTGLLTRTAWMNAVREQLLAGRSGIVLVADVEGLAALDERHGYASGNLVLCELGADPRPPRNRRSPGRRRAGAVGRASMPPRPMRWPPRCATTSTPASAPTA